MLEVAGQRISVEDVGRVAAGDLPAKLAPGARQRIARARKVVERIVAEEAVVYGVSTGFGRLSGVRIPPQQLRELQLNLVRSHACGLGDPLTEQETRAMMLMRANVLAVGCSGARVGIIEAILEMLKQGVHPIVPSRGSVGASGDLAPLAHLALVVIGEGEAIFEGRRMGGAEAMRAAHIEPVELEAKEGLALLNGTQAMGAVGALALLRAQHVIHAADIAGAMTLEALLGTPTAFDARIQEVRPQHGQAEVARHLRDLLEDSEIRESHMGNDPRVQDAYSLRCMPQVHGAVRGAVEHAVDVVEIETASATDNPLIFAEDGDVLSGGNFHGAPLGYAFDYAAIALCDLMSISERRIDRLVNPDANEHLPPFLTSHPGAASGFMIAHVTAAALLSEAKVLAHPASVDNVPTSGGQEDHVSMGMTAALKLRSIVDLAEHLVAIELLAAAEGLEYRAPLRPGKGVRRAWTLVRSLAPRLAEDRALSADIEKIALAVRANAFADL